MSLFVGFGFPLLGRVCTQHRGLRKTAADNMCTHSPAHAVFIINNSELQPIQAVLFQGLLGVYYETV